MEYLTGTVKWFSNAKGLGFINPVSESRQEDIFIHYSVIQMEGFKTLKAGQTVQFLIERGDKGFLATVVIPVYETREDYVILRRNETTEQAQ
ncbi:hypothetical protein GCM10023116_05780 [Kistimonas scapharcae]|uniref:CSD domain-containing protein n=1 Tax=Kistimonas scapharcae TaxID=1036133 RepID=A0ABP8UWM7_9GAMM